MTDETPARESPWRRFALGLSGPPPRPRFRPLAEIVLPLVLALGLTGLIRATHFDLAAQQWFHRVGGGSWALGEHPFWKWLYLGGTAPAALAVFAAIGAYLWSWRKADLAPWRRVFLFLILAGIVGPGILTNGLVKEYWGRPRPRELVEFGGRSQFEPVLSYDSASEGLSFPCGHATMGFYFLAFYFVLRRHRPALAAGAVFGSLAAGGLMGIARSLQGAHFLSDTLWAAVICWFTPLVLYHVLGLDRRLVGDASDRGRKLPIWGKGLVAIGSVAILAAVLLGTPYEERRTYTPLQSFAKDGTLRLRLVFARGAVEVAPGEQLRLAGEAYGHGLPTSKIGRNYWELPRPDGSYVVYSERISGWFKELNARLRVEVPWERTRHLDLETGQSQLHLTLGKGSGRLAIKLAEGGGRVVLDPGGRRVSVESDGPAEIKGRIPEGSGRDPVRIVIAKEFTGTLEWAAGE